jgi:hypothetical protein
MTAPCSHLESHEFIASCTVLQNLSRLNTQRLQSHKLSTLLIDRYHVVLRPCTLQINPEHLDLPITYLLDRVKHILILRLEALLLDLFNFILTQQLLQVTYASLAATSPPVQSQQRTYWQTHYPH